MRLELAAADKSLDNVIHNYFDARELFAEWVTDKESSDPQDHGGDGKGGNKSNPPPGGANSGAGNNEGATQQGQWPQGDDLPPYEPPRDERRNGREGRDNSGGGNGDQNSASARAAESWAESETRRDMAVWFAELLREMSIRNTLREQAGALFFKFERQPEIRDEIIRRIRTMFAQHYPQLVTTLPQEDETRLDGYISVVVRVMRGTALANILFEVANEDQWVKSEQCITPISGD